MQANQAVLGVGDLQLRLTPLEEVFLNVARKAELEHAQVRFFPPSAGSITPKYWPPAVCPVSCRTVPCCPAEPKGKQRLSLC